MKFLALITLASLNSFAQSNVTLETIQVRGTKEEKSFLQNTESVSILQQNELPATGRENSIEVLKAIPNVDVNKSGESFSIRGINNTGVTGHQKDNLSSIVIDDVFQTDLAVQAGSFDLWDVERIEVLRGAQSTNQGVNSLAGTILLDHQKPQFANEGFAKLGAGNFGQREFGVLQNILLKPNELAIRLSYVKEQNDGFIKNVTTGNDKWGESNKDRAQLGLFYQLNQNQSLKANINFNRHDKGGTYSQGTDAFRHEVTEDHDYNSSTANIQSSVRHAVQYSEQLTQTTTFGFSKSTQNSQTDADGSPQPTAGTRNENHNDNYLQIESRFLFKNENLNHLFGIHAHDFSLKDDYTFNLLYPYGGGLSTPLAVKQGVDRSRRALAAFDSLTYKFSDNHALTAGLRAEYVESKYGTDVLGRRTENLPGGANGILDNYLAGISGAYEGKQSSFVILPKIGYLHSHSIHSIGLTYTRGYRTAGVGINRRQAKAVEYNPEFTNNYELAYKWMNNGKVFTSNLFYIDWRDQQVQVQLSNDFYDTQIENAARSEVLGGEMEMKWDVFSSQKFSVGLGYNDTKFKDFQTRNGNYADKKFPFASHWTTKVSYEWKASERLSFLTVARHVSESYANAENTRRSDAQTYVNLNGKYTTNDWLYEGYVNNVFDGEFRTLDGTPTGTGSTYQASYHQTNTPRELGVRVNYFW